jgi:hypothetical protein
MRNNLSRCIPVGLLAAAALLSAAPAEARGWLSPVAQQLAYQNGYRQGLDRGQKDARAGRALDYTRQRAYRQGDSGYKRQHGDREAYRHVFRDGYVSGYANGYRANTIAGYRGAVPRAVPRSPYPAQGRYPDPRSRQYYDAAYEAGYSDGYAIGLRDGRSGSRFDLARHGRYRSADRGYNNRYGSKDRYRNLYRDGFRTAYQAGYSDALRYQGRMAPRGSFFFSFSR